MSGTRAAAPPAVPLFDLRRLHAPLEPALVEAFERVLANARFAEGQELESFEEELAAYCGAAHCVGVSDGTEALRLALVALGAGPGRSVVTVPATFVATVEAIDATGARPVLVDIDPETRCMSPAALEAALGPDVAAAVPVHLYGKPAPMGEIGRLCADADVPLLEDAAQAHGAELGGRRAGSLGRAGAFSFYPTKNLGALGDGGAVVTDDGELAAAVRVLRHHGSPSGDPNRHLAHGATSRLDELQAALLRLKLPRLDAWNAERRAAAERYREHLAGLPLELPPPDPEDGSQVFHLFVVLVEERDRVLAELRTQGVDAAVHYPTPVHLQSAWQELGYRDGDFPATEDLCRRALTLPLFPGITNDEIDRVAAALERLLT